MGKDRFEKEIEFERIYREMFIKLTIYAENQLNSKSLAEDAVQETFRIAWIKFDQLIKSPNPNGWLMNTLKFVISSVRRNIIKANKILATEVEFNEKLSGSMNNEVDPLILYKGKLSEDELNLLKKYAIEGCSLLEISKELGISLDACKKRVQRVKEKFKKEYSHF